METLSKVNQPRTSLLFTKKSSFEDTNSTVLTGREIRREKRKKARNK